MKPFDDFHRRILPRVKGAALPLVDESIRQACNEFLRRTRLWRDEDEFNVTAGGGCEPMVAPAGAVIIEIESARFDGNLLEPVSRDWLDGHVPRWRERESDQPRWVTQSNPDTVRLVPEGSGQLSLSLYLGLSPDATLVPDFLIDHHLRVIVDGALAELFSMPTDFANPGLAQFHSQRFEMRLDELFQSHATGQQSAPVRTKAQFM